MHNSSVQFYGVDNILTAYDNCEIPDWAFLQGKGIICAYNDGDQTEGRSRLEQWLGMLEQSRSTAVYALQLYKDPGGDITNKTPYNFRFQCKLVDEEAEFGRGAITNKRVAELEARLAEYQKEEEEGEEIGGVQGFIAGIVKDPQMRQMAIAGIVGLVRKFFGPPGAPVTVSGVPTTENIDGMEEREGKAYNSLSEHEQKKLTAAMIVLMEGDPEIGTNLLKLASILQNDPGKYKLLCSMA